MQGDFSRDTFHRQHHFARVLMQQGRVLLDSDWNEQTSILLHYLRTLAADLIGPHGGPGDGFKITCTDLKCDFVIERGHYYVDGILCENNPPRRCPPGDATMRLYSTQPDYPLTKDDELKNGTSYLVYLDVWERHLTHLEVDHIREVALGGPDTATRAQVVCQVKVATDNKDMEDTCAKLFDRLVLEKLVRDRYRCLRARARVEVPSDDPCIIPPEARYRGAENQLYRVEIHDGGAGGAAKDGATFKWSRDNGSVVFALRALQGSTATLETLGPDNRRSLKEGDWVEIVDDYSVLRFAPRPLVKVEAVDRVSFVVTLAAPADVVLPTFDEHSTTQPLLRRWDQGSDVLAVQEGKWIDLEDGVQVYFQPGGSYRASDYWLIPARSAIGDVLWPTEEGPDGVTAPQSLPPHGIEHHYAPLARISVSAGDGNVSCDADCRCTFVPLCAAPPPPLTETAFNEVFFGVNSLDLTDDAQTGLTENVEPLKDQLSADPNVRVEVRGFESQREGSVEGRAGLLAQGRAKRVAEFYLAGGIPSARLSAVARGAVDPANVPLEKQRRVETVLVAGGATRPPVRHLLHEVEGVGDTFVRRLEAANIVDAAELARLEPAKLAEILTAPEGRAVPESTAASIIENARRLVSG